MANPTRVVIPSRYSIVPLAFAFTAATGTEQSLTWHAGDILIATNAHATDAKTVTVKSNPTAKREEYDITAHSIPAGQYRIFPRFPAQDAGVLKVTGETTDIKLAQLGTQ
jgi:hypothetical protein